MQGDEFPMEDLPPQSMPSEPAMRSQQSMGNDPHGKSSHQQTIDPGMRGQQAPMMDDPLLRAHNANMQSKPTQLQFKPKRPLLQDHVVLSRHPLPISE